jgi:hypothetical protein
MNKLICIGCRKEVRSRKPFDPRKKCSCGGFFGIHIKGSRHLFEKLPDDTTRLPRRYRPTKKNGVAKNQSAINGAKPCSSGAKI